MLLGSIGHNHGAMVAFTGVGAVLVPVAVVMDSVAVVMANVAVVATTVRAVAVVMGVVAAGVAIILVMDVQAALERVTHLVVLDARRDAMQAVMPIARQGAQQTAHQAASAHAWEVASLR